MLWKVMHGISVEDAGNAFLLNQASSPVHRKPPFSTSPHGSEDEASIDGWMEPEYNSEQFICIIPVQTIHKLYIVVCKVMQLLEIPQPLNYMLFIPAVRTAFATINSSYSLTSPALLNTAGLF